MESLTICLPPHHVERLWEILDKIPPTQRQISIKKWHKVLGELCSMSFALPGSRNIFSTMQNVLASKTGGHLAFDKGVHHALEDFRWMQENISSHPTQIAEVVPLLPVAEGHHDSSGLGAGGIWFPSPHLVPHTGFTSTQPLVWWHRWPDFISTWLVMADNPHGSITNSDLELAGGPFHLDALSKCFDIRERTVLSKGDNLSTTFWECRGSTSTNSPPAYLLRLFGMHQRFIDTCLGLIIFQGHPIPSLIPFLAISISTGLTNLPTLCRFSLSTMGRRFGPRTSKSFLR